LIGSWGEEGLADSFVNDCNKLRAEILSYAGGKFRANFSAFTLSFLLILYFEIALRGDREPEKGIDQQILSVQLRLFLMRSPSDSKKSERKKAILNLSRKARGKLVKIRSAIL
jgi:hypothetical protein